MKLTELSKIFKECGVVGAGGAGFPSYAKLNEKADTIILNCAECEPLLKLHRQVMAEYAYEILYALNEVKQATGAKEVIIAIKPNYKQAIQAIEEVISSFEGARIGLLPPVYPSGDEVVTIYEVTGRVVPAGKLPIEVGCIVYNVETMLNAYYAITQNKPVTHKYCTVTGAVKNPVTLKLPLGMKVSEVIKMAGGATIEDYEIVSGGPMTGRLTSESDVVTKTSNAYIILPPSHFVVQKKKANTQVSVNRAMSACCHCGMCTSLCSRHMLGYPIDPTSFMNALSAGATGNIEPYLNTFFCSACGLCEMYSCFQNLNAQTLISVFKGGMRKGGVKMPEVQMAPVDPLRSQKLVSHARLTARLGLTQYNKSAPLNEEEPQVKQVKIMLSQHIGAPSECIVKKGDKVTIGQVIGKASDDKLGVNIHSSVNGTVQEANDKYVKVTL